MSRQYYTYLYIDPHTDEVFYVGKGCCAVNGKDRAYRHLDADQDSMVSRKSKRMIREGTHPIIHIIDCSTEQAALDLEKGLIRLIGRKDLGLGTLLNLTDGGENPPKGSHTTPHSEETKRLISEKKRSYYKSNPHPRSGKTHSEETRMRISAAKKGRVPWNKGLKKVSHV